MHKYIFWMKLLQQKYNKIKLDSNKTHKPTGTVKCLRENGG